MSQLVTGDAVVLGLQPARLPSRAMAVLLDLLIIVSAYLLITFVLVSSVLGLGVSLASAVQVALYLLLLVGVPIAVETLSGGRSIGKAALGLRVVRADGGPIRFRHALVRGAVGVVELLLSLGSIAVISSLVSAEGRRLGDIFAGTLVVRERLPGAASLPVPSAPPWLAGQFSHLDLSRVPDDLWLSVRQLLTRLPQLDQAVAWSMAVGLSNELMARVGVQAPPGVQPVDYLSAVMAERQNREAARAYAAGRHAQDGGYAPQPPYPGPPQGHQPYPQHPQQFPPSPAAPPSVPPVAPRAEEPPAAGGGFTPPA
ncbi:RDD family protein [Streptomyces avicenniae]|uniref:RDD family protein n=1 Tax=Streptomyces avicenniae TaxID=500153 RepID=UPI00069BAE30|nr:RDD family protein [Streptomyces avicenniae]